MNCGDYEHMLATAEREILDEFERVTGSKAGGDVQMIAALAADTAIMFAPQWRDDGGYWQLYFNYCKFEVNDNAD